MYDGKFEDYWNQVQFCYFKAEAAKGPASKHLWIHLAQDWIALADTLVPTQSEQPIESRPTDQLEQLEPFLVA